MVAAYRLDGSDACELVERGWAVDVAGVHDQLHASHHVEEPVGKPVDELRAVRVRHHSDECGQAIFVSTAGGRIANSTSSGVRLSAAAIPNTASWPAAKAAPPMSGPTTPPT